MLFHLFYFRLNAAEILALVQDDDDGFDDDVADPVYEAISDSDSEEENLAPSALLSKSLEPTKRSAVGQTPGPSKKLRVAPESDEGSSNETLLFFDPPEERPDADTDRDSGTGFILYTTLVFILIQVIYTVDNGGQL